jgi:hypothetical protein
VSFSGLTPVSSTGQAPNPVSLFLDSPIKSGNDDVLCIIFGIPRSLLRGGSFFLSLSDDLGARNRLGL